MSVPLVSDGRDKVNDATICPCYRVKFSRSQAIDE